MRWTAAIAAPTCAPSRGPRRRPLVVAQQLAGDRLAVEPLDHHARRCRAPIRRRPPRHPPPAPRTRGRRSEQRRLGAHADPRRARRAPGSQPLQDQRSPTRRPTRGRTTTSPEKPHPTAEPTPRSTNQQARRAARGAPAREVNVGHEEGTYASGGRRGRGGRGSGRSPHSGEGRLRRPRATSVRAAAGRFR